MSEDEVVTEDRGPFDVQEGRLLAMAAVLAVVFLGVILTQVHPSVRTPPSSPTSVARAVIPQLVGRTRGGSWR